MSRGCSHAGGVTFFFFGTIPHMGIFPQALGVLPCGRGRQVSGGGQSCVSITSVPVP